MTKEEPRMPVAHADVIARMKQIDQLLPGNDREDITALLLALVDRTVTSGGTLSFLRTGIDLAWTTHPNNDRGIRQ